MVLGYKIGFLLGTVPHFLKCKSCGQSGSTALHLTRVPLRPLLCWATLLPPVCPHPHCHCGADMQTKEEAKWTCLCRTSVTHLYATYAVVKVSRGTHAETARWLSLPSGRPMLWGGKVIICLRHPLFATSSALMQIRELAMGVQVTNWSTFSQVCTFSNTPPLHSLCKHHAYVIWFGFVGFRTIGPSDYGKVGSKCDHRLVAECCPSLSLSNMYSLLPDTNSFSNTS